MNVSVCLSRGSCWAFGRISLREISVWISSCLNSMTPCSPRGTVSSSGPARWGVLLLPMHIGWFPVTNVLLFVCTFTNRYSRTLTRWWRCCWFKHWAPWSPPFLYAWTQLWSVQHKNSALTPCWSSTTSHPPLGAALKPPCCHTSVWAWTHPQWLHI